jgi:glycosyltransferase involved in cell wall biosynthesis
MVTKLASVIVPAYNEEDGIGACLESLLGIDYPNVEIIVVDDKSSDKTAEIASRYPVRVVRRTSRGERCIARNDGIKLARGEFIAFVDADCTVKEDWLSVLISDFADETIGAVGGIILTQGQGYFASYRNYSARENYGDSSKPIEVLDLPGGNCCYRAEVLRQLGGFDPNFGRHETYELGVRLRRNGYKLIGDPRSVVWHGHEGNLRKWFGAEYGTGYTAISLLRLKYLGSADLLAAQLRQVAFIGFLAVMVAGLIGFAHRIGRSDS